MDIAPLLDIPEVKPAIEQIRGQWHQKVSPKRRRSLAQSRMGTALTHWAGSYGEVGTEWRCYLFGDGDEPTSLGRRREQPTIAPDIAVDFFSPSDARKRLREKIALYFAFGSRAVVVVDPELGTNVCGGRSSALCGVSRPRRRSRRALSRSRDAISGSGRVCLGFPKSFS